MTQSEGFITGMAVMVWAIAGLVIACGIVAGVIYGIALCLPGA